MPRTLVLIVVILAALYLALCAALFVFQRALIYYPQPRAVGSAETLLDDAVRIGAPAPATELMLAYVYDYIERRNPVGFFGMVHVLEGTSTALATAAAQSIRSELGLPPEAFTYLTSHGALDQEHVRFFAGLMDRLEDPADQAAVTHVATMVYRLYGDIFRALPRLDAPARVSRAA
jgi:pyrroloquinoline quinone (PQQ) biosynthesis protein C